MNDVNVSRVAARTESFVPMMSRPRGWSGYVGECIVDERGSVHGCTALQPLLGVGVAVNSGGD